MDVQAGLRLCCLKVTKSGFLASMLIMMLKHWLPGLRLATTTLFHLLKNAFEPQHNISSNYWHRILEFGTKLDGYELYCATKKPHIAYQSL